MPTYTTWYLHGEKEDFDIECETDEEKVIGSYEEDDMQNLIREIYTEDPNSDADRFFNLVKDPKSPLYLGCGNFSNLSFYCKVDAC